MAEAEPGDTNSGQKREAPNPERPSQVKDGVLVESINDLSDGHDSMQDDEDDTMIITAVKDDLNVEVTPGGKASANQWRAPDGGWGWMVVLGCALMHLLLGGLSRSYGVIYVELQHKFHSSSAITAWVGGSCNAIRMGLSPLGTTMSDRFGTRVCMVVGGLLLGGGCLLSAFTPSTEFMFLSYSIIVGIGGTLVYAPSLVLVGKYFDKKRSIAVGFSSAGSGVGVFSFPPLMEVLFREYGYQGAMIILGGIMFNVIVSGALHRPLRDANRKKPTLGNQNQPNPLMSENPSELSRDSPSSGIVDDGINSEKMTEMSDKENDKKNTVKRNKGGLCQYLDLSLLREPVFLTFLGAMHFFTMSYFSGQLLLPDWGLTLGHSPTRSVLLLSVLGIADLAGRVSAGFLFNLPGVRTRRVEAYTVAMLAAAATHFFWAFSKSYEMLAFVSVVHGLFNGICVSQRMVILADLLGVDKLSSSFGLTVFTQGVGIMIGPAFAGFLRDKTGSYVVSYLFSGSACLVGVGFMLFICAPRSCRGRCGTKGKALTLKSQPSTEQKDITVKRPQS